MGTLARRERFGDDTELLSLEFHGFEDKRSSLSRDSLAINFRSNGEGRLACSESTQYQQRFFLRGACSR